MKVVPNELNEASQIFYNYCFECESRPPFLIEIGEESDYESYTTQVCLDCLKKAVALAEKELEREEV